MSSETGQPPVSALADLPKARRGRAGSIPLPVRLKVRSLYLIQQLPAPEIGRRTGLTQKQVSDLANREGWTKARKAVSSEIERKSLSHTRAEVEAVVAAVAQETEALTLGTLAKAHDALARDDKEAARDLQAYSQAAKNFVGMARQARGLDDARLAAAGQLVVFVGDLERVAEPKRVTEAAPAIPVSLNSGS